MVEGSGSLGPDSVSSTPSDEACLDLARSNMSTPIQESRAQLSGPDIPGAQINEDGKWVLMVKSAFSINPVFFESCGASINAIMDGWKLVFSKDGSWCNELQVTGKNSVPEGNSPEFESIRLGGRDKP